jgi:hypothetical protein
LDQPEEGEKYTVIGETGDAWFSSLKLMLPTGHAHEVQLAVSFIFIYFVLCYF